MTQVEAPPRVRLNRDRVLQTAVSLADRIGSEALSMRRLAARLNCEAMSLYNYVRDKADLLDAVHAAVLGNLKPETRLDRLRPGFNPDNLPKWRRLLGDLARALRTALLAHPNVVPLFTTQRLTAPEAVTTVGRVQMALTFSHFSDADAQRALYVVGMFTIGHAVFEKSTRNDATFEFGLEALLDAIARDHRKSKRDDE